MPQRYRRHLRPGRAPHCPRGQPGRSARGKYDAVGQLTDIHDTRRGHLAYQYDPIGRLLQATSRLGVETFAFDPAGNLLDDKHHQPTRPLERTPKRNRLMDNLLREYAGTHYTYDERGNLRHRLHNGVHATFTWDLFDRLHSYSDDKLKVDYCYDALGRRLHKHSTAHHWDKPEAGTGRNQLERAKRQRELNCGFTLFGWGGATLAGGSLPAQDEGDTGRSVHYLYEPGSFVPVAQALRKVPIQWYKQPDWINRIHDIDQDPLWQEVKKPQPFDCTGISATVRFETGQQMSEKLKKLLSIASAELGSKLASAVPAPNRAEDSRMLELKGMLREKNGFYAFASALHVFPSSTLLSDAGTTLERWNAKGLWRFQYDAVPDDALFFAEDVFGVQFCLYQSNVLAFDPEIGKFSFVASNLEAWAFTLLEHYDYMTGYSLGHAWQTENGALAQGYRLLPKQPFVLGGAYEVDNLYPCEAAEGMRVRGDLARQIKALPDGAQVKFEAGD